MCTDSNRPAKSKHSLHETWPASELVHDMAKFIGFAHHFKLRIAPLRKITKHKYTDLVQPLWTEAAQEAFDDMKLAIISNPCLQRFDHCKLVVIRTDFSSLGFGYVLLNPSNDKASTQAALNYRNGKGFSFMTKESTAHLHPVCFGACKCYGNKVRLHSHLGKCLAGNYAINKMRHYVFGQQFVWVTDCYAVKFLLSYDGGNPAILCLQMRLMCWDINVIHHPDSHLVNADYWSHLGTDIEFNPLFQDYLQYTMEPQKLHAPPMDLPMHPENMPYYRSPRIRPQPPSNDNTESLYIQSLLTDIVTSSFNKNTYLTNILVRFGHVHLADDTPTIRTWELLNSKLASYAFQAMYFNWAVYSFSKGHFSSTVQSHNLLSIHVSLACNTTESGCALFQEFTPNAKVFSTGHNLLNHIRTSGDTSVVHGYLINSYRF